MLLGVDPLGAQRQQVVRTGFLGVETADSITVFTGGLDHLPRRK